MNVTKHITAERDSALAVGDYNTYRAQATRRVHALRKRIGRATPKGHKYSAKSPITAEDIARDNEFGKLLLMCAERAWAGAMAVKSAHSMGSTQERITGSTKKQIISRMNKAIQYAKQFTDCVKNMEPSQRTNVDILEAEAYLAGLRGAVQFEKSRWIACIQEYSVARVIYATLGSGTRLDFFKELLSSTIDPSIRYAAYQSKVPRTKAVSDIAIERFPSDESILRKQIEAINADAFMDSNNVAVAGIATADNIPSTITWRNRTVKLEDALIAQAVGAADAKERQLAQAQMESNRQTRELATAYDDVINARQDALDATKSAIDELTGEGVDASDTRIQSLHVTKTALSYGVIELRIGRNRVLCGSKDGILPYLASDKPSRKATKDITASSRIDAIGPRLRRAREKFALYDSILQDLDAVKELPGVAGDSDFLEELSGKRAYFRALKCLTIGQSHAATGELTNALALYARSLDLLSNAISAKNVATKAPKQELRKLDVESGDLNNLHEYSNGLVSQYRALVELRKLIGEAKVSANSKYNSPLVERLDEYPENDIDPAKLVNFPPTLEPIPVKPLFFDIAWSYLDYPGHALSTTKGNAASPKSGTQEKKEVASKGWFGFKR